MLFVRRLVSTVALRPPLHPGVGEARPGAHPGAGRHTVLLPPVSGEDQVELCTRLGWEGGLT